MKMTAISTLNKVVCILKISENQEKCLFFADFSTINIGVQNKKTHSIQLVMITTMGVARGEHSSIVNQSVILDNLSSDR